MSLPDAAILIRGGLSAPSTLHMNAQTTHDEHDNWAVSAFSAAALTLDQIAEEAHSQGRLPHRQITMSTVGRFRNAGFDVEPTPNDFPHVDILLGEHEPSEPTWELMASLFDPPQRNSALSNEAETD